MTPGQVAYEAYAALLPPRKRYLGNHQEPWDALGADVHTCWDAAAQAVLEAWIHNPALFDREEDSP